MTNSSVAERNLGRLMGILRRLRSPDGCPWDREQQKEDLARYVLEEAFEVVEAIENGAPADLREELGDLFFQILFLSRIAEESGDFDFAGVMAGIEEKMIRRHPHVFGEGGGEAGSAAEIRDKWEIIKNNEGKRASTYGGRFSAMPKALPALMRAQKIAKEAAQAGFDRSKKEEALKKAEEELEELKSAIKEGPSDRINEEMGDLLFSLVNLCRFLNLDAEASLRSALNKFILRFSSVEKELLKKGKTPAEATLPEMDMLWEKSKQLK